MSEAMTPKSLSALLYQIQQKCRGVAVLGIHWIQLQYPVYPVQDRFMARRQGRDSWLRWMPVILVAGIQSLRAAVRLTGRLVVVRCLFRRERQEVLSSDFDVVAKSWAYGVAKKDDLADEYLGDLQARLQNRHLRVLLLCGDARDESSIRFARSHFVLAGSIRAPEECLLSPFVPWASLWHQISTCLRLLRLAATARMQNGQRNLYGHAACEVMSPTTLMNTRYFWLGRTIMRRWAPKLLLTLFEGRSWERCLWVGVRSIGSECKIGGYQHAVVFPFMRSLISPATDDVVNTSPDYVLCQGEVTKRMLEAGHSANGAKTMALGSFRRSTAIPRTPDPGRRTILVIPVGWIEDSTRLFNAAASLAVELDDHNFLLRCHPVLPFDEVRPYLDWDPEEVGNIEVSTSADIETDIERASVVIYRGTSAVFPGVVGGLKPIYAAWEPGYDEDPLFEVETWCERPESISEAVDAIRAFSKLSQNEVKEDWEGAVNYVEQYFLPVSESSVDTLVGYIESSGSDSPGTRHTHG